ncbi:hypothetical protein KUH32_12490 [Thalassococcus sp. CAU 1522]|uniref:Uncharacterized protein n=1 Tax=Thalassococcus arenae TaxID=2851652 RepID=A0ABS6N9B2_9RHOB|nr:hypothetical protein [Thalassococcus arenae]MBV2360596.1 hypothetical protein [Thalassococcus arenae]
MNTTKVAFWPRVRMLRITAALLVGMAGPAGAAPLIAITEGHGPDETVLRYELGASASDDAAGRAVMRQVADGIRSDIIDQRRGALLDAGLQIFGDLYGGAQSLGTLGEHALMASGLSRINTLFTYGGAAFAAGTAARQFAAGDTDEGMATATKGLINFAISEFGWGALQVAGVSLYVYDIVLREWQTAVLDAGAENFRGVYDAEMARRARSLSDWKRIVWALYLKAEADAGGREPDANRFRALLDAEIADHVTVRFTPEVLLEWDKGKTGLGLTGFHEIIEDQLADDRADAVRAMLTLRVLPEIMRRAADRTLEQLLATYNTDMRREMNRRLRLQVTVFGLTEPTRVSIPLPAGGSWDGEVGIDGSYAIEMTNFARIKAGLPDRVRVDMPGGPVEKPFLRRGQQAVAVFGTPVTPYVARYRFEEGPIACRRTTRDATTDAFIGSETFSRDGPAAVTLDMAALPGGTVVVGRFDAQTRDWPLASPGLWRGTDLHLGAPRVMYLARLRNCRMDFFTPQTEMQAGDCQVLREYERIAGDRRIVTTCDSTARLTLSGLVAEIGGAVQVLDVQSAEGKALIGVIRQSLSRGIKDFDPSLLGGMSR